MLALACCALCCSEHRFATHIPLQTDLVSDTCVRDNESCFFLVAMFLQLASTTKFFFYFFF